MRALVDHHEESSVSDLRDRELVFSGVLHDRHTERYLASIMISTGRTYFVYYDRRRETLPVCIMINTSRVSPSLP